jgi:hypothetical protein
MHELLQINAHVLFIAALLKESIYHPVSKYSDIKLAHQYILVPIGPIADIKIL